MMYVLQSDQFRNIHYLIKTKNSSSSSSSSSSSTNKYTSRSSKGIRLSSAMKKIQLVKIYIESEEFYQTVNQNATLMSA